MSTSEIRTSCHFNPRGDPSITGHYEVFSAIVDGCLENDDLENDDLENNDLENDDLENDDLENNDLENDDLENDDLKKNRGAGAGGT